MSKDVILVGAGEHARVVGEAVRDSQEFSLIGFVDPQACEATADCLGVERLGDDAAIAKYPNALLVLGMGEVGVAQRRPALVARLQLPPSRFAVVVHSHAWVSKSAQLGPGTVVMAGCVVQSSVQTGTHCIINSGAVVEHDVLIGDYGQVSPGAIIGGGARIGAETFVGLGARVRDHIEVGRACLIAMGATVTDNVADRQTVLGTPARPRG